jgi:hypothetical protein
MEMENVLVPLVLCATLFGILYVHFTTRNKERLALIDKGADASIFRTKNSVSPSLKWGIFLIGIALGILIGSIIDSSTALEEEVSYFSMIFLFGGLSLVVYYYIERKILKDGE